VERRLTQSETQGYRIRASNLELGQGASQDKVRDALLALNETLPDLRRAAGRRDEVDPIRHLIVTATGWGLNPDKDAIYLNVTPSRTMGRRFTR